MPHRSLQMLWDRIHFAGRALFQLAGGGHVYGAAHGEDRSAEKGIS